MSAEKLFFHIDIDAFYASVEQLDNPQYKNKPVIVGGQSKRSVVSTCSYEARKYGIHSAMPMTKAKELCPNGIFIAGRMQRYKNKSKEIMNILKNITPCFHQISIDEAFLDMSGMQKLLGDAETAARNIKIKILSETGLIVSVGGGNNKYIAKIASGISKPDGLHIIPAGSECNFMKKLPLKKVWGIGNKTIEKLNKTGVFSVDNVLALELKTIKTLLGESAGEFLYHAVRGNPFNIFEPQLKNKSIGTEKTFEFDLQDKEILNEILFEQASEIMFRMIDENIKGKTIIVKIRYSDFKTVTIRETGELINDSKDLYKRAKKIFEEKYDSNKKIRLLGITVINIEDADIDIQQNLFYSEKNAKENKIEQTALELKKTKNEILQRARFIKAKAKK